MKSYWKFAFVLVLISLIGGVYTMVNAVNPVMQQSSNMRTVIINAADGWALYYQDMSKTGANAYIPATRNSAGNWLVPAVKGKVTYRLDHPTLESSFVGVNNVLGSGSVDVIHFARNHAYAREFPTLAQAQLSLSSLGAAAFAACDTPPAHDCFTTGAPGCTDYDCCESVGSYDSWCVTISWDSICVSEAYADSICMDIPAPENDLCEDAIAVAVPSLTAGTTVGATTESGFPNCPFWTSGGGVWYSVQGTGGTMIASFCSGGGSATYDTILSVFCLGCDEPVCVAGNDDSCGLQSQVTWCSQNGAEYLICVHGYYSTGNFNLFVDEQAPPPCANPILCLPSGACCLCLPEPWHCEVTDEATCTAMNGIYIGDDTECEIVTVAENNFISTPGLPIYDYATITDTIAVPVGTGPIGDVNIRMDINHTWMGDMWIDITHLGNLQNIWAGVCGSYDNIKSTADREGWEIYCTAIGGGPSGDVHYLLEPGVYAGYGDLDAYEGMDADGDWVISIYDQYGGDTGYLNEWAVELSSVVATEYPCEGIYPYGGGPGPGPGDEDEDDE